MNFRDIRSLETGDVVLLDLEALYQYYENNGETYRDRVETVSGLELVYTQGHYELSRKGWGIVAEDAEEMVVGDINESEDYIWFSSNEANEPVPFVLDVEDMEQGLAFINE